MVSLHSQMPAISQRQIWHAYLMPGLIYTYSHSLMNCVWHREWQPGGPVQEGHACAGQQCVYHPLHRQSCRIDGIDGERGEPTTLCHTSSGT